MKTIIDGERLKASKTANLTIALKGIDDLDKAADIISNLLKVNVDASELSGSISKSEDGAFTLNSSFCCHMRGGNAITTWCPSSPGDDWVVCHYVQTGCWA